MEEIAQEVVELSYKTSHKLQWVLFLLLMFECRLFRCRFFRSADDIEWRDLYSGVQCYSGGILKGDDDFSTFLGHR